MSQTSNAERLRRAAFPPDLDLSFGEAAVAKGYLTPERLEECRRQCERLRGRGAATSIGALLLKRRDLTVDQYLDVLNGREVEAAAPRFVLGKYRIVRELGRGGMGIVYEARDSRRRVALKVLKPQDPPSSRAVDRFRREAAIGAKLRHPNIVRIEEFGAALDSRGRQVHFLAMEYVEGRTLSRMIAEEGTAREELLRVLEEVGRAVAFAHGKGVVHRDLKPSNVLVEKSGRPVLADFGAAQAEDFETRLTTSGVILGTPAYMAPEQVRGEVGRIDARTDVYALGAILYEVLTGGPPYREDHSAALIQKILLGEPLPPRRRAGAIDPQLELIVLKSMDKDPEKRYASAREWVEDLARYRRGKPVEARRTGLAARLARRLAGKKTALALAGALLVVSAAGALALWRERRNALEDLRRRTATAFDAALELRRAGRIDEMRRFASETEAACREAIARGVREAESRHLLGRMRRALMDDEEAFAEQERALAAEPGYAPAIYERAVLTARLHSRRVDEIAEEYWRDEVDARVAPVLSRQTLARGDRRARELRNRLKADLEGIEDPAALGAGELLCARGLMAWIAGDMARARKLLTEALERAPALEEACEALAMLEMEQRRYAESIRWFTQGLARDQGYLPFTEGRAFARLLRALELSNCGGAAEEEFAAAAADYAAALKKDPRSLVRSGLTHLAWAFQRAREGRDPGDLFAESIRRFDAALAEKREVSKARLWRGLARTLWGLCTAAAPAWGGTEARDPGALSEAAIADFSAVIVGPQAPDSAWMWRGAARFVQGLVRAGRFADPSPSYEASLADLGEAIRRNPARDEAWMWRGITRKSWAIREFLTGRDPKPGYDAALSEFDEAIRRNPGRADTWTHLAEGRLLWATFAMPARREDPRPVLTRAIRDLDESIRLNPSNPQVWTYRACAKEYFARLQKAQREPDASHWYASALGDFEEAMRLDPTLADKLAVPINACVEALKPS